MTTKLVLLEGSAEVGRYELSGTHGIPNVGDSVEIDNMGRRTVKHRTFLLEKDSTETLVELDLDVAERLQPEWDGAVKYI